MHSGLFCPETQEGWVLSGASVVESTDSAELDMTLAVPTESSPFPSQMRREAPGEMAPLAPFPAADLAGMTPFPAPLLAPSLGDCESNHSCSLAASGRHAAKPSSDIKKADPAFSDYSPERR